MKMGMKAFVNYYVCVFKKVLLFENNLHDKTWQKVNKIINNKSENMEN